MKMGLCCVCAVICYVTIARAPVVTPLSVCMHSSIFDANSGKRERERLGW